MRKLYFLALIVAIGVSITTTFGQNGSDNFILKNSEVTWQKVFPTSLTFNQVTAILKNAGIFETFEISNNLIIGDLKQFNCLYEESGFTYFTAPDLISSNNFIGFYILEFKEGKYRVTVKRMKLIKRSYENGNSNYLWALEHEILKEYGSQFRDNFLSNSAKILDYTLTKMFDARETKEENW